MKLNTPRSVHTFMQSDIIVVAAVAGGGYLALWTLKSSLDIIMKLYLIIAFGGVGAVCLKYFTVQDIKNFLLSLNHEYVSSLWKSIQGYLFYTV
jgi:hypothetical protein